MTDGSFLWDGVRNVEASQGDDELRRVALASLLDAISTRPGERAEDVLLDLQLVDDQRLALSLACHSGIAYQGLRGFSPDARLFLYVPLAVALERRIVPLLLVGDTLTLATEHVDVDLAFLHERFPNLELALVISPRREILEALRLAGE